MQWNVLYQDFNARKIVTYDIFKHGRFAEDVLKLLKEDISKEEFAEQLRRKLSYHFRSKCEWEVVISSWPVRIDKEELDRLNMEYEESNKKYGHYPYTICTAPDVGKKIDVYDQVMLNWDVFVDYIWKEKNV